MDTHPKITVFMAVYNGERFLKEAIDSVLDQTFTDFELLIINDSSTDQSVRIINSYQDPRIRLLHNEKNLGVVETRNRGLKEAKGEFLAILDCDDISPRRRLEKELNFLMKNPDFGAVGGATQLINEQGRPTGTIWKNAVPPEKVPATLLFMDCFSNSSMMLKMAALPTGGYRDFGGACDYDLFQRMSRRWQLWNLPEIMLRYRLHGQMMTTVQNQDQKRMAGEIAREQLTNLSISPSEEELLLHRTNFAHKGENILEFLDKRDQWLRKLKKANEIAGFYSEPAFSSVIADRWFMSCIANTRAGWPVWEKYKKSPLSKREKNLSPLARLAFRCAFKIKSGSNLI